MESNFIWTYAARFIRFKSNYYEINDGKAKDKTDKHKISYVTKSYNTNSLNPAQFTDANLKILIEIFYKWMEPKEKI